MSDFNQCTFTGRLGADPETKSFQNGGKICNLRLACGESWKDKATGERKERTEWVAVVIRSEGLIGVAERFLRKGSKILVQGQMQTRKWQDQSGADRYSTEVVLGPRGIMQMLDGKQDGEGRQGSPAPQREAGPAADDLDDSIPF